MTFEIIFSVKLSISVIARVNWLFNAVCFKLVSGDVNTIVCSRSELSSKAPRKFKFWETSSFGKWNRFKGEHLQNRNVRF